MFSRIQNDGLPLTVSSVPSPTTRADLAVNPVPTGAELPEVAVSGTSDVQHATNEHNAHTAQVAGTIDQIRKSFDRVKGLDEAEKKLSDIRERLLSGRHDIEQSPTVPPDAATKAEKALAELQQAAMFHPLRAIEASIQDRKSETVEPRRPVELPPVRVQDQEAPAVGVPRADRERVLDKIQNALERIDRLQSKIGETKSVAHDQIFNLSTSVSGLNNARTQVAESPYSLTTASTAVDNIMLNVKAAVMAHGKASTDIVRLILT